MANWKMYDRVLLSFILAATILVSGALAGCIDFQGDTVDDKEKKTSESIDMNVTYNEMTRFSSFEELEDFVDTNRELSSYSYYTYSNMTQDRTNEYVYDGGDGHALAGGMDADDAAVAPSAEKAESAEGGSEAGEDYSTTNVQEEGVDEGDIVKNDGEYAYIVSSNRSEVFIIDIYPPEDTSIVATLEFNYSIEELYLTDNTLTVLGVNRPTYEYYYGYGRTSYYPYYDTYNPETRVEVYDITGRSNPVQERNETYLGSYVNSRIIGGYLYLIASEYFGDLVGQDDLPVPASEIYYAPDYDTSYQFTKVMGLNVLDPEESSTTTAILMGRSSEIYVSTENIYITYISRMSQARKMERRIEEVILPVLPSNISGEIDRILESELGLLEKLDQCDRMIGGYRDNLTDAEEEDYRQEYQKKNEEFEGIMAKELEKTTIHRISVNDGGVSYEASGGVPGHINNRFSMDEHNGHFRIATTTRPVWRTDTKSENHVFVLDMALKGVGSVTGIAPGESIFSARFIGDRGYLVTFKQIDPFFVIDLSDPANPYILGELKIPGYSDYLHPYDENHVIGLGKDADASIDADKVHAEDSVYYTAILGVKLSLFDVSDLENPKEIDNYVIGDRGTSSLANNDPHAFLFAKHKNLLVIPILLSEGDTYYGGYTFSGAYVFNVDTENGFELRGRISHAESEAEDSYSYYGPYQVKRSFYIEDTLYTVSDYKLKANDLGTLEDVNTIDLPHTVSKDYYYYDEVVIG